jgi:dihydrofolate reductase
MRKIFAFLMVSLDGYHEGQQHELDWHNVDAEFHDFAVAQLDEADTLLFGRKTYQMMAEFWPTDAGLRGDPEVAARMNSLPKLVISRSQTSPGWTPVTVLSGDVAAQLAALKEQPGKDIALLGSSELAASLLDAGLLDELRLMVNPVALGTGHPVLAGARRTALELDAIRQFASGNVLLTYLPSR